MNLKSAVTIGVLSLPGAACAEPSLTADYVVTRAQASPSNEENQVAIISRAFEPRAAKPAFWVIERRVATRYFADRKVRHEWADSRTCPAVTATAQEVGRLPPTRLVAPGGVASSVTPFHVAVTAVRGQAAAAPGGVTSVTLSDWEGPVTRWWIRAEKSLAGCWKSDAPRHSGEPVRAWLGSAEDARNWSR